MDSNLPDDNTQLNNTSTVSRTFRPIKLSVLALIFTFAIASAGGLFYLRFNNISKNSELDVFVAETEGYVCKRGGPSEIYENGVGDLIVDAYHQSLSNGNYKACTTIKNTASTTRTLTKVFSQFCPDRGLEPYCNPDNFGGNWGCGANRVEANVSISIAPGETKEYCREISPELACGLAQWDITMNDFAQYTDSAGNKYFPDGYFGYLYYFGTDNCPAVQCVTNDFVGETNSGWDECNYCVDRNNDGKYDNNPSQTCLQREIVCRQKTYNRLSSVYPNRVSMYPTPTDINKTDEASRILWFNWAYKLDKHQDTYPNEPIISEGTACGSGEVCCLAPNSPTPTPTPTPVIDPTISCESLEGVVKDNSGVEANLASLPNDFVGTIDLTCTGRSTRKDITKITFTLTKDLNGNITDQEKIKTGTDITLVSNESGVKTFRSTATFNITGQGNYKVKSKVCNEDNTCSP